VSEKDPLLIAFDQPWTVQPITQVELQSIELPTEGYQFAGPCGARTLFARAIACVATDRNGDGRVSSDEIISGLESGDVYGIHQEIVTWNDVGCDAILPNFPVGLRPGVHVNSEEVPVFFLDGKVTELQTCVPNTTECGALNNPFSELRSRAAHRTQLWFRREASR